MKVASGCHAWLQPDGSWGWSNSGPVQGVGASSLVDTLFDLPRTRDMLDGMASLTRTHPIQALVNTHSGGDHYLGEELVVAQGGVEIVALRASAELMTQDAADTLVELKRVAGFTGDFARSIFAFEGITSTGLTRVFEGGRGCGPELPRVCHRRGHQAFSRRTFCGGSDRVDRTQGVFEPS